MLPRVILLVSCLWQSASALGWRSGSSNNCLLLADRYSQGHFYQHNGFGGYIRRSCSTGLIFSQQDCTCVHPPKECILLADGNSPEHFYEKSRFGSPVRRSCVPGLIFDQQNCTCVHPPRIVPYCQSKGFQEGMQHSRLQGERDFAERICKTETTTVPHKLKTCVQCAIITNTTECSLTQNCYAVENFCSFL